LLARKGTKASLTEGDSRKIREGKILNLWNPGGPVKIFNQREKPQPTSKKGSFRRIPEGNPEGFATRAGRSPSYETAEVKRGILNQKHRKAAGEKDSGGFQNKFVGAKKASQVLEKPFHRPRKTERVASASKDLRELSRKVL